MSWPDDVRRAREDRPKPLIVPAPILREGLWLVLLWAEFTGRTEIAR